MHAKNTMQFKIFVFIAAIVVFVAKRDRSDAGADVYRFGTFDRAGWDCR
jgi:hypothetical protein